MAPIEAQRNKAEAPQAARARRAIDVLLVLATAPVWILLMACTATAVALSSGRPVLFTQTRIGRNREPFTMLKFRSMTTGPNPLIPSPTHITKIGAILRRTSIDELPQLVNVLRGEMSLVGPRPMLPEQSAELSERSQLRHSVRPGLTGLAQVSGRNTISWAERIELDLTWVQRSSVRHYLQLLSKTASVVKGGHGVAGHVHEDPLANVDTIDLDSDLLSKIDLDSDIESSLDAPVDVTRSTAP